MNEEFLEKTLYLFVVPDFVYDLFFLVLVIVCLILVELLNYSDYLRGIYSKKLTIFFSILCFLLFIALIISYFIFAK